MNDLAMCTEIKKRTLCIVLSSTVLFIFSLLYPERVLSLRIKIVISVMYIPCMKCLIHVYVIGGFSVSSQEKICGLNKLTYFFNDVCFQNFI